MPSGLLFANENAVCVGGRVTVKCSAEVRSGSEESAGAGRAGFRGHPSEHRAKVCALQPRPPGGSRPYLWQTGHPAALSTALLSCSLSVQDVGESWGRGSSGPRPLSPGPSWCCQSRGTSKEEVGSDGLCTCLRSNPQGSWAQGCGTPATWAAEVGEAPPPREPRLHRAKGDGRVQLAATALTICTEPVTCHLGGGSSSL